MHCLGFKNGGKIPRMPLYEYHCEPCDHSFETLVRSMGDVACCPRCGSFEVAKLLSVPAAAQSRNGHADQLPIHAEQGGGPAFGCGRPQCGQGMCAGLE
jgi:putative FmdB family regulatory protein